MNYEIKELKSKNLIMKRGTKEDYLKVYEYEFNKLKNIDGIYLLEKQDHSKIENLFKGGEKRYFSKLKKAHMFDWIIYKDNNPIGNILTTDESILDKKIEVKVNIHPDYWGKNYAKEALDAIMDYLFSLGYDNILCEYEDGNLRAKRVLDKLGFKPYSIEKDSFKSDKGNLIDVYKTIMIKENWFSKTGKLAKIEGSI